MSLGLQERHGTYTGKLGFLNPYNEKGKLKLGASWENWRDKKITPKDIENVPTEGFIINRNEGVRSSGWYWNSGREAKIRVWDPRSFEIEITIPNMLYILEQSNSYKGKGLEGNFVYGYNGSQLMLIPVDSEEYKGSAEFTDLKYQKVTTKELTPGATIFTKDQETVVYVGKYEVVKPHSGYGTQTFSVGKELVFSKGEGKKKEYVYLKSDKIAKIMDTAVSPDFAYLVEEFEKLNLEFPRKNLDVIDAPKIKAEEINRYARKVSAEVELGEGMLFVPQEGGILKGYRVIQVNKQKFRNYGTDKKPNLYPDGWEVDYFKLVNPYNLKIEKGANKILPGKEEPQKVDLNYINKLNAVRIKTHIAHAYDKKIRILG